MPTKSKRTEHEIDALKTVMCFCIEQSNKHIEEHQKIMDKHEQLADYNYKMYKAYDEIIDYLMAIKFTSEN